MHQPNLPMAVQGFGGNRANPIADGLAPHQLDAHRRSQNVGAALISRRRPRPPRPSDHIVVTRRGVSVFSEGLARAATTRPWVLPTTAGCSDACQQAKNACDAAEPTVPGDFLVEAVETPWVQESADDQQGWAGELVCSRSP